ncbi:F0F1 ATP synthase subunit gamma [Dietzia sp.]|uniref:F0F1 ATP synthase subunit gamma n=1 Tax=Dietzia sp. TaxID=1871616 RepID=UPI002FD8F5B0
MANLRELRSRIKSVNSTKKITKAQELIATSQITKAQQRVEEARPYADQITAILQDLASASSLDHKMLNEHPDPKRAAILVVSSDRGMCGGYNYNVFKATAELRALLESEGKEVDLYVMGGKGVGYYRFRGTPLAGSWTGFSSKPVYEDVQGVFGLLAALFRAGAGEQVEGSEFLDNDTSSYEGVDEVHLIYTRFESMLTQTAQARRLAPIETVVGEESMHLGDGMVEDDSTAEIKPELNFEPDAQTLLDAILPRYLGSRAFAALLESAASESAARRTAMKAATDNATELVNNLSREANQARQAQITQEISEIVGGVDALAASAGSD